MHFLTAPPVFVSLTTGETMLLFVLAMTHVMSATLVVERVEEGHAIKVQRPVYLIS